MLSGTHDADLLIALDAELHGTTTAGLSHWSDQLTDDELLGLALPLLDDQLATHYSPRPALNTLLSQVARPFSTLDELASALDAVTGISVVETRDLADNLELDLQFQVTTALSIPLSSPLTGVNLYSDCAAGCRRHARLPANDWCILGHDLVPCCFLSWHTGRRVVDNSGRV